MGTIGKTAGAPPKSHPLLGSGRIGGNPLLEQDVVRIFLSYGHDEYASLASRIKRDLESKDNKVWFDVERLKTGGDWERYIEAGLDFASAYRMLDASCSF